MLLEAEQYSQRPQDNTSHKRVLSCCKSGCYDTASLVFFINAHTNIHNTHTCAQTTTGDDVKDFAKQLKNKLTRKYRRRPPKKTYLDYTIQGGGDDGPDRDTGESLVFNNVHTRISNMAQRLDSVYLNHYTTPMYSNSIAVLAQRIPCPSRADVMI